MIELTRLNNQTLIVNVDLIKFVEATPDTVLTLSTGEKLPVKESCQDVVDRCVAFKARIAQGPVLQ